MLIIPRSAWAISAQYAPARLGAKQHPTHVEVHHSVTQVPLSPAVARAQIRSIHRYHTGVRNWTDIAYHYLVDPNTGDAYEGRDVERRFEEIGAVAVCCLGNFEETDDAGDYPLMLEAIGRLADLHGGRSKIDYHRARGERRGEHESQCPGKTLIGRLPGIIAGQPHGDDEVTEVLAKLAELEAQITELREYVARGFKATSGKIDRQHLATRKEIREMAEAIDAKLGEPITAQLLEALPADDVEGGN